MRLHALHLAGALIAAAIPLSAAAVSAAPDHRTAANTQESAPAADTCPLGYYWKSASYARHGKYRPAHCALRW